VRVRLAWRSGRPAVRGGRKWLIGHVAPPDWGRIFTEVLQLIGIDNQRQGNELLLQNGHGAVSWQVKYRWSIVEVDLKGFTAQKQQLVTTALWKSVRYG